MNAKSSHVNQLVVNAHGYQGGSTHVVHPGYFQNSWSSVSAFIRLHPCFFLLVFDDPRLTSRSFLVSLSASLSGFIRGLIWGELEQLRAFGDLVGNINQYLIDAAIG
jgi:hypothetical protein